MNQSIVKFLEFKGKTLLFLSKNGTFWIAVKPICEALGVNFNRQYKNLYMNKVFGPALANLPMQVPGSQVRNMICLPEHLVYGWLFTIHGEKEDLIEYQKECNDVLFNHFHGTITRRSDLIRSKARLQHEIFTVESQLFNIDNFKKYKALQADQLRLSKELKSIDQAEINDQLDLFGKGE
ncbi:MAG: phage antirepressor N-terminal domain-containing protein [Bacteroidales bacterium]